MLHPFKCPKNPKVQHNIDLSYYPGILLFNPSDKTDYCPVCSQDNLDMRPTSSTKKK